MANLAPHTKQRKTDNRHHSKQPPTSITRIEVEGYNKHNREGNDHNQQHREGNGHNQQHREGNGHNQHHRELNDHNQQHREGNGHFDPEDQMNKNPDGEQKSTEEPLKLKIVSPPPPPINQHMQDVKKKPAKRCKKPKGRQPLSKGFIALEVFLLPFGFNLFSANKPNWKSLAYILPLRLLFASYVVYEVYITFLCYMERDRFVPLPGCAVNQYLANNLDTVVAVACFVALICHGDTLRKLMHVAVNEAHEYGETRDVIILAVVSVQMVIASLVLCPVAMAALSNTDFAKLYFKFKIKILVTGLIPFFLRLFTSLVVSTIGTILISISILLTGLKKSLTKGTPDDSAIIDERCRIMARLVYHFEACFSGLLPVIFAGIFANFFVVLDFFTSKDFPVTMYLHLLVTLWHFWLLLTLLFPAMIVNAKLKSVMAVSPKEPEIDNTVIYSLGVFSPTNYEPPIGVYQKIMYHHQSRLPVITAGGVPISVWFIINVSFLMAIIYWFRVLLETNFETLASSVSKMSAKG